MTGTIYLIHFDSPLAHARHYLGYTKNLAQRLEAHRAGTGARLMQVVTERGIGWQLARTWQGGRTDERKLKNRKKASQLCPICRQGRGK